MSEKVTRKELYQRIMETMKDDAEVVALCEKQIEVLSRPRKPYINRYANEFAVEVAEILKEANEPLTNKQLTALVNKQNEEVEVNYQKVAAALRKLVNHEVLVFDNSNDDEGSIYNDIEVVRIEPETKSGAPMFEAR